MTKLRPLRDFEDVPNEKREANAVLAAEVIRRLVESSSWGEIPVAPAFESAISIVPKKNDRRVIEVKPIMPTQVLLRFLQLSWGSKESDKLDSLPTLHGLARALQLPHPQVCLEAAGTWALQGLPGVRCSARAVEKGKLDLVSQVTLEREVAERADNKATAQLAKHLLALQSAVDARTDLELPRLEAIAKLFPVTQRKTSASIETGLRWIDFQGLLTALGLSSAQGAPIPIEGCSLPLSHGRFLEIAAYISKRYWVRTLMVAIETPPEPL